MSGLSTQNVAAPLKTTSAEGVRLSRTHNTADSAMPAFTPTPIRLQPQLTVNTPGDKSEQEADRVADAVMRMPDASIARDVDLSPALTTVARKSQPKDKKSSSTQASQSPATIEGVSTPVPQNFHISRDKQGVFAKATGTINGVKVEILPDERGDIDPSAAGSTSDPMKWKTPRYEHDKVHVTRIIGIPSAKLTIKTTYATLRNNKAVDPNSPSGYGRGTTVDDRKSGNTSLRFHEGSHGTESLDFIKQNPLPSFEGKVGMTIGEYRAAEQRFQSDMTRYQTQLESTSIANVDCVGTPAPFCPQPSAPLKDTNGQLLQPKLTINTPGDKYEQEADRVADMVMRMPEPQVQRQCACGKSSTEGECSECKKKKQEATGSLQRVASSPVGGMTAPPIVNNVLSSPGSPMPTATRSFMESRFAQDFSHVRVHTDAQAQKSAEAVSARAYTVGHQIVFGSEQFQPESAFGKHLLAHELTHIVQQGGQTAVAQPMLLQRYGYDDVKRDFYRGLISGLKTARSATISAMRGLVDFLPDNVKGIANRVVDVVDTVMDITIQLDLFVVGMVVGFGEGIVGMIKGLLSLGYSILKTLWHAISGFFTGFDPLKRDAAQFLAALVGLPGALKQLVTSWMAEFEHAPMERQSLMIGELTGQIEALIATFALSAGRAGTVAKVASEGAEAGQVAATATRGAEVVDLATVRASKLAQAAESTGTSGRSAGTSASAFDGAAARQLHPLTEPAVVPQPAKVIQFPKSIPANDVAALPKSPPSKLPIAGPVVATAGDVEDKRRKAKNSMSVQVQWTSLNSKRHKKNNKNGKVNFSQNILRDPQPGVTVADVTTTFDTVLTEVEPRDAQREAASKRPDLVAELDRVRAGSGIPEGQGGRNVRVDLDIEDAKGGRIDVVNHRGHNLRT